MSWQGALFCFTIAVNVGCAIQFVWLNIRVRRELRQIEALNFLVARLASQQFNAAAERNAHWWRAWAGTMGRIEVRFTTEAADES